MKSMTNFIFCYKKPAIPLLLTLFIASFTQSAYCLTATATCPTPAELKTFGSSPAMITTNFQNTWSISGPTTPSSPTFLSEDMIVTYSKTTDTIPKHDYTYSVVCRYKSAGSTFEYKGDYHQILDTMPTQFKLGGSIISLTGGGKRCSATTGATGCIFIKTY